MGHSFLSVQTPNFVEKKSFSKLKLGSSKNLKLVHPFDTTQMKLTFWLQ
jgi:hypothetical protein